MQLTNSTHEKTLKLAFLGLGWIGRNCMNSLIKSGLDEPAIIVNTSFPVIEESKKLYPDAEFIETFTFDADIDKVVIATPTALHVSQAAEALNAGMLVFWHKPLARNSAETQYVLKAAKMNKLYKIVYSGEIGKPPPDNWIGSASVQWAQKLLVNKSFNLIAEKLGEATKVIDLIYQKQEG